jgi:hypothetical protein
MEGVPWPRRVDGIAHREGLLSIQVEAESRRPMSSSAPMAGQTLRRSRWNSSRRGSCRGEFERSKLTDSLSQTTSGSEVEPTEDADGRPPIGFEVRWCASNGAHDVPFYSR